MFQPKRNTYKYSLIYRLTISMVTFACENIMFSHESAPGISRRCTKTAVRSWKENKQRSAPSVHKQENCRPHQSNRGQTTVDKFKCDLCDADYVGYIRRPFFQRIEEHKHSAYWKHLRDAHNQRKKKSSGTIYHS